MTFKKILYTITFAAILSTMIGCGDSVEFSRQALNPSAQTQTQGTINRSNEPRTSEISSSTIAATDIEIDWSTPTTREDGTSLDASEIGGYAILSVNLDTGSENTYVLNGSRTNFTIRDLSPGNYQFYIYSYDSQNRLSLPNQLPTLSRDSFPQA